MSATSVALDRERVTEFACEEAQPTSEENRERVTREEYERAFMESYEMTLRFLIMLGATVDTAEEIAQAAWAKGWEYLGQLRNPSRVGVWVNSIAKNLFRNEFHRNKRLQALSKSGAYRANGSVLEVREILKKCTPQERSVLRRRYLEGYTSEEIAGQIGLTPTAVRVRLLRLKQALRARLSSPPAFQQSAA